MLHYLGETVCSRMDGAVDEKIPASGEHELPEAGDRKTSTSSREQPDPGEEDEEPEIFHECSQEPEEETLYNLEKDLSQEEKERRKEESGRCKDQGNTEFKKGDYIEAENSYTQGLQICPACYQKERAVLFSNRAAARMKQDKKDSAISDCSKAIKLDPDYIRALLRRAELYEKTDKLDDALEDYKRVLERDPSVHPAREACMRLPKQIEERNEKMKEEMISKLKDLGNLVLRPFGLSTENFRVNQDSTSGSYSVNFVQNPNNNNR
ncbi:hypothetical protein NDU88_007023 [Pleurodeles waltl]|uniref:Tetratricopeptide repeat protein 1 n=1 Tax=Pleurodeles waltl TaxID=8319 RepID=A0AAV7PK46_PLEWA|nr:hypothetical protein NDU88_007023 [Pleurodeles waltl]